MRRIISTLIIFLFFIWILPLGAFIRPEKEEKACNGQRAICLCSHLLAKHRPQQVASSLLKNGTGTAQKESPGSASHFFIFPDNIIRLAVNKNVFFSDDILLYISAVPRPVEHVPKHVLA